MEAVLPKAVQKQADNVKKIEEEMAAEAAKGIAPTPPDTAIDAPLVLAPTDPPTLIPAPVVMDEHEHKYKVLQGKYNAEVPRLFDEIQTLKTEKNFLVRENLTLKEKLANAEKKISAPAIVDDPEMDAFKKQFPDVYVMMEKMLKTKDGQISELENTVKTLSTRTDNISTKTFWDRLTIAVPTWETIDKDPRFMEWLQFTERYSPYTRHQLLSLAMQQQNVETVANFFTDFMKSIEVSPPAAIVPASPNPKVAEIVAPPKPAHVSVPPGGTPVLPTYKRSEVIRFYKDKALSNLKEMTPEQIVAKDLEYTRAGLESRIVEG